MAISEHRQSGKILVRVPVTLHEALVREAAAEGISLNQLILSKLSIGLGLLCSARPAGDRTEIKLLNVNED
jgi:hypothetical protein